MGPTRRHRLVSVASRRILVVIVAALALGAALLAAGATRAGTGHLVEIEGFAFAPQTLTIRAGDTVTWTNLDDVEHTATSTSGAFDSGLLAQGESYTVTFTEPGTYDYLCTPHPMMTGRIVVEAAPAAPAPSTAPAGGGGGLPDVAMAPPEGVDARTGLWAALLALAAVLAARRWRGASR
jgi:amicyanin